MQDLNFRSPIGKKCFPKVIEPNVRYPEINSETVGDIEQFNSKRIRKDLLKKKNPTLDENLFKEMKIIPDVWHKYCNIDSRAVSNTFQYIFYKLKKGIFVRIANNQLQTFLPFKNVHYKNEFSHLIKVEPKFDTIQEFLDHVSSLLGYKPSRQQIQPLDEWRANNPLLRYEKDNFTSTSSSNHHIIYDMLKTLCEKRQVPDIEFFINYRDFPLLTKNDTEPYNHIFGTKEQPLLSHKYDKYAPIFSSSTNDRYADIIFPTYEDWARAIFQENQEMFGTCNMYPNIQKIPWNEKYEKAIFRGSSTGSGINPDTNQRLKALELSQKGKDLLDAGITKWNIRPRKLENSPFLQTIARNSYPKVEKLNLQEQSKYKYILTLEGHVAAYRLSYELSSRSVILLAKSKWNLWYYPLLEEYKHYVPVDENLDNLYNQIRWCQLNDDKCKEISENAYKFYKKYLGTQGILDFLQKGLWELSKKTTNYKYFPDLINWSVKNEKQQLDYELANEICKTNCEDVCEIEPKENLDMQKLKYDVLPFSDYTYKHPPPTKERCIGLLDGMMKVVRSKNIQDLKLEKTLLKNANGIINLFSVNGFYLVGKKASNELKNLEHIHENYIGLKAINKLISRIPNFAYTFGPLKNERDMVFNEYINGVLMMHWLKSNRYNFETFLTILVQLNLSLSMAQNYIGFIHYDLYPWNVMLKEENSQSLYPLFSGSNKLPNVVECHSNIIPYIIDFGKSRAIVYESEHGMIDHGFSNLYKHNSIIDTLTILYGSLCILKEIGKFGPNERKLLDFAKKLELPFYEDVKRWGKFGALFDFNPISKITGTPCVPKNFIDFVITSFPNLVKLKIPKSFSYQMEQGINSLVVENYMKTKNMKDSLLEYIKHVDKSRPPQSNVDFFQKFIHHMLIRRMSWVENEIAKSDDWKLKNLWKIVKDVLFTTKKPLAVPASMLEKTPQIDFPKASTIGLDSEITPNYIKNLKSNDYIKNKYNYQQDWMTTWVLCLEMFLFGVVNLPEKPTEEPTRSDKDFNDFFQFIEINGFLYHNAIASSNTLEKIKACLI